MKHSGTYKCEHPSWIAGGDGHLQTWWNCAECGEWRWIAPWITRVKPYQGRHAA